MNTEKLAERLFPEQYPPLASYEDKYPPRNLSKGAEVTRLAPSPTGFIHLGNLFVAIANERIAHQSGGILYLRIEDTDEKRKVDGAVEAVKNALRYFDIKFDEGAEIEGDNTYAPWYQRQRAEIYRAFVKELVKKGRAYPCFCTEDELSALREKQTAEKRITGYYGEFAACRALTEEEIYRRLDAGIPYVIRLKSLGNPENKLKFHDEIKGEITVTENDQDVVILKSDGIPTYHFAHAIDDHFMRTTLVIRGEEWLSSLPIHIELFQTLGFERPRYGHNCSLMKQDGETRRKLSKRKDPELSLEFYRQEGYFARAVKVYMLTLLNSNFEEWYLKNPEKPLEEFRFSVNKMGKSGALFDLNKLNDISANELSRLSAEEMLAFLKDWADEYGTDGQRAYFKDEEYMLRVLNLCMGTGGKKRRKDFVTARQAMEFIRYFFEEESRRDEYRVDAQTKNEILKSFGEQYSYSDDAQVWFSKVKEVAASLGFAAETKDYKANPEAYKGSVADVAEVLRIALTGRANTPDLWTVMQILGEEVSRKRLQKATEERA
ncbi:MAG: glutamate--tRNA ligase [Clostridia bacterium]|nr:glutamate--tRNA ligase [Clostridia bacterium]